MAAGSFEARVLRNAGAACYMLFQGKNLRAKGTEEEHERVHSSKRHRDRHGTHKKARESAEDGPQQEGAGAHAAEHEPVVPASLHSEMLRNRRLLDAQFKHYDDSTLQPAWVLEQMFGPPPEVPVVPFDDQMAVLRWVLETKQGERPATWADRRRLQDERSLLQSLLKSGSHLPLKDL